jgi:hypothetical protein
MIRVLIDRDRIAVQEPVRAEAVVVRDDTEVEVVEPETFPGPTLEMKHMARTEAASKMPVLPRMIVTIVGIATTRIVPHPTTVVMDVGGIWMFWVVGMAMRAIWMSWLVGMAMWGCRLRNPSGTGTVRRNVSSADAMAAPAWLASATTMTAATTLCRNTAPRLAKSGNRT